MHDRYQGDYPTVASEIPRDVNFEAPKRVMASDIMSDGVISVTPETHVMDVVKLLSAKRITGVPVVEDGKLVGVISEKDTFKLILNGGFTQAPTGKVKAVMSTKVATVKPTDDVFRIAQMFYDNNYRRLPVVDGDEVVGIISRRDILECIKKMGH